MINKKLDIVEVEMVDDPMWTITLAASGVYSYVQLRITDHKNNDIFEEIKDESGFIDFSKGPFKVSLEATNARTA